MIRQLSHYQSLRQKILKKHSFTLSEIQLVLKHSINSIHSYLALAALYFYANHLEDYYSISIEFFKIMEIISKEMHTTHLYQLINLKVWRTPVENLTLKKDCKILRILSEWMTFYQQVLSKTQNDVFINLLKFIESTTSCNLQRIIFIDQAFEDLKEIIAFTGFWEDPFKQESELEIQHLHQPPVYQNLKALVDVITLIVPKIQLYIDNIGEFYNPLLKYLESIDNYNTFVYRSIKFLLENRFLVRYEKELSIASLIFLQRAPQNIVIQVLNLLITKTTRVVRFALAVNYQKLLQVLYKSNKLDIVQEIQNLPQIRELVMRNIQKNLTSQLQNISNESMYITVNQRQSVTFYFEVTKPKSIIILEYILQGDIGVTLNYEGDLWVYSGSNYMTQTKSKSKSIQILSNNVGLHSVVFNNKYSWLTSKNIKFSLKVFKPYEGSNSQFDILVYPDEYTPWNGYKGVRFDDEQGQFLHIWKSPIGQKSDIIIFQSRCFFGGVITPLKRFKLSPLQKKQISKCLIVGEQGEYEDLINQLKQCNPQIRIRYCQYEDI